MTTQRMTGGRGELDHLWATTNSLVMLLTLSTLGDPAIGNGTTAGTLRTTAEVDFRIGNREYTKASTDDLWDLSAETDTEAGEYRAYWLLLDDAGAATIEAGDDAATAAAALRALPDLDGTKAVIGVFVAGPETDFDAVGGLSAQGDVHDGIPDGVPCGVPRQTYAAPGIVTLIHS